MTTKAKPLRPFLKWAGGKRQLLAEIRNYVPYTYGTYYEPFLGAGAVLFHLQPTTAVVNDLNFELMNTYRVVQTDVESLIDGLAQHQNNPEYFYRLRNLDRSADFSSLSLTSRASRIIYLNKTCYNGLFRVNRKGHFNVPYGNYKNPKIVDPVALRAVHRYLTKNRVTLLNEDFQVALQDAVRNDFVYLDPPYDPVSQTASFTSYSLAGFDRDAQLRLKLVYDELNQRGCKVLLSNSATPFVRELYQDYQIVTISAKRPINSNGSKRGAVEEVLVLNYDPETVSSATGNAP